MKKVKHLTHLNRKIEKGRGFLPMLQEKSSSARVAFQLDFNQNLVLYRMQVILLSYGRFLPTTSKKVFFRQSDDNHNHHHQHITSLSHNGLSKELRFLKSIPYLTWDCLRGL